MKYGIIWVFLSIVFLDSLFAQSPSIDLAKTYELTTLEDLNSSETETLPYFSPSGDTLFFVSRRGFRKNDRLWFSILKNGTFSEPELVTSDLNSTASGGITSDRRGNYFMVRKTGQEGNDLDLFSIVSFNPFELAPLVALNTRAWDAHPSISLDGAQMYFASNRKSLNDKSQVGNTDIYVSNKDEDGDWDYATPLPDIINSTAYEGFPTIDKDGRTLYFTRSVNGRKTDLFMTSQNTSGVWSTPIPLPEPFNSLEDDASITFHPSGTFAVFSSVRREGKGNLDLYLIKLKQ